MNASAIITYHPIIFHGIKKLTPDDRVARIVMGQVLFCVDSIKRCIKNDIAVYSPHTACDAAKGGVNDWIVDGLGEIASSAPITPDRENPEFGIGRIATLASPYPTISQLIERMKVHFSIPHLQLAVCPQFALNVDQSSSRFSGSQSGCVCRLWRQCVGCSD